MFQKLSRLPSLDVNEVGLLALARAALNGRPTTTATASPFSRAIAGHVGLGASEKHWQSSDGERGSPEARSHVLPYGTGTRKNGPNSPCDRQANPRCDQDNNHHPSDCKGFAVVMDAMGKQADRYFQNIKDDVLLQTDSRTCLSSQVLPLSPIPLSHYYEGIITPRPPVRSRISGVFLDDCGTSQGQQQRRPKMGENEMKGCSACSSHQVPAAGTVQRALSLTHQSPFLRTRGESGVMQQGTPVDHLCFIFSRSANSRLITRDTLVTLSGTFQPSFTALRRFITPSHGCVTAELGPFMSRYKARHP